MNIQLPIGLLTCHIAIFAIVLLSLLPLGCEMPDSRAKRIQTSETLKALEMRFRDNPNDNDAFQEIEQAANSEYRFERCYALGILQELGKPALPALHTMQRAMLDSDPYVRDAGAHAISEMGAEARPATSALITSLRRHPNEGSALFVVKALVAIGDPSPEVLDALRFAAAAPDSYAREEAENAIEKLTLNK